MAASRRTVPAQYTASRPDESTTGRQADRARGVCAHVSGSTRNDSGSDAESSPRDGVLMGAPGVAVGVTEGLGVASGDPAGFELGSLLAPGLTGPGVALGVSVGSGDSEALALGEGLAPGEALPGTTAATSRGRLPIRSPPAHAENTEAWSAVTATATGAPTRHTKMSGPWLPSAGRAVKANHWPSGE